MINKKILVSFFVAAILLDFLFCWFMSWREMRIVPMDVSSYQMVSKMEDFRFSLDRYNLSTDKIGRNTLKVSGWCIKKGEEISSVAIHVVLSEKNTNNFYKIPTMFFKRPDVTAHFHDGNSYDYSGFNAEMYVDPKVLSIEKKYLIFLAYQLNDKNYLLPLKRELVIE